MKTPILILCLGALLSGQAQDTPQTTNQSPGFYSTQHPEWPPMPQPPEGVRVYLQGTNYFLDDRNVEYPAPPTNKSLVVVDETVYLRHPELIPTLWEGHRERREQFKQTGDFYQLHVADSYAALARRLTAMSKTNTPAPYTRREEMEMKRAILRAEAVRTNRAGVLKGMVTVKSDTSVVSFQTNEEGMTQIEQQGQLARQALESNLRSPTDAFWFSVTNRNPSATR